MGTPPLSHVSLAMDEINALEMQGYQCHTINYGRNDQSGSKLKKVLITVSNAIKISREIRKIKPDFLFLNSRFEPVGSMRDYITIHTIRLLNNPLPQIIIKSHGSDLSILNSTSRLYKKVVVPYLTKKVYRWLFLSNEERDIVQSLNPEMGSNVRVIPNIIIPERCIPDDKFLKKYSLPKNKFVCLFAGRITEVKGVFDILECINYLRRPEDFHFLFVGKGNDMNRLQQKASAYLKNTSIEFTGFIPDAECDKFYSIADVLIYPTFDTEGFPMALFKSIACGLPVITTNLRAARDYLKEPENVFWVNPHSPKEIANALEKIYSDEALRKKMHENNQKMAKKFSTIEVGKKLDFILNSSAIPEPQLF